MKQRKTTCSTDFLRVFCETGKKRALLTWECKSPSPSPSLGSARLCWAGCSGFGIAIKPSSSGCLWTWGKLIFFFIDLGELGPGLHPVTENWFNKQFILLCYSTGLAGTFYQRREKSLNLNPSLPLASPDRVAPLSALRAESLWTFLKLLLTD